MLIWRLSLGTLLIAALVGLCWLDWQATRPGIVLLPLAITLSLLAAGELLAMFRQRGHQPLAWAVYSGTLLTILAASAPGLFLSLATFDHVGRLGWLALGLAAALLLAAVGEMRRFTEPGQATTNLALSAFAFLYVGGLMGFLVQLRLIDGGDGHLGMFALVSLIAIVKMSDIGQYTAGRIFGRHKLAPQISPGKTWEGVFGGVLFACTAAWVVMNWLGPQMIGGDQSAAATLSGGSFVRTMVYAVALAVAGIVGDLTESLLKRDAGVKDSSTLLPGFGGVLDLLDSLLGAAPVAYLFWALGWVGL